MKRYKLLKTKKYLCVPTCILTVLDRLNIKSTFTDIEIGCALGLIVSPSDAGKYPCARVRDKCPKSGYGTQLQDAKYSLQHFFDKNGYKLDVNFHYPESYGDFKLKIINSLESEHDVLICFSVKEIFNQPHNSGHVAMIESLNEPLDLVIINHGVKSGTIRKRVSLKEMYKAVTLHGVDNKAGLWLLKYSMP